MVKYISNGEFAEAGESEYYSNDLPPPRKEYVSRLHLHNCPCYIEIIIKKFLFAIKKNDLKKEVGDRREGGKEPIPSTFLEGSRIRGVEGVLYCDLAASGNLILLYHSHAFRVGIQFYNLQGISLY